jgi:hypothetical protein
MNEETFKKAVDSLEGFECTIGVMGGEPTLHPQFEAFARYIEEKHPPKYKLKPLRVPVRNFIAYIRDKNYFWDESINLRKGPGLCTATGKKYYEHFEIIQDVFSFQLINDHKNSTLHQPLLVSRRDLGIPDEEWFPLRDKCWVQNMWSASITPKGAFFCEIAGALDMLFNGPGGWQVEPGWWKREPPDFGEQLNWCELCGAALSIKGRLSSDGIDDVSPTLLRKLEEIDSPGLKKGRIVALKSEKIGEVNMPDTPNRYIQSYHDRISMENRSLFPRSLSKVKAESDMPIDVTMLLQNYNDWIFLYTEKEPQSVFLSEMHEWVFNPGVLYMLDENSVLFNVRAHALRGISKCINFTMFKSLWSDEKKIELNDEMSRAKVYPDLYEWAEFAGENNLLTEQTRKVLMKIATDYGVKLET